jgi:predicted transcriptional regulator
MAFEGSLKEFGLADILQLIYFQRKTGVLTLEGRMDRVRLLFYEGNIISAETRRKREANRFGKLLFKKGLIKEEDLQKALEEQQSTGEKLGNILIKNGIAEKEQILEILTAQITEIVIQLFSWKDGDYEFSPQGVPVDKEMPVSLDTQHVLMEGLRIVDEWSLIEGKLSPDTIFEKTGKPGVELTPDEEEILGLVDGERDVSATIEASRADSFQASKSLVSLMEKGIIEPKEAAPVAPEIALHGALPSAEKGIPYLPFITPVIFIVSLFIAIISFPPQRSDYTDRIKTSADIDNIRFIIEAYKYENGSYPQSTEQVTKPADSWGRRYIYKPAADDFVLFSAGPDGKEGTADDIY